MLSLLNDTTGPSKLITDTTGPATAVTVTASMPGGGFDGGFDRAALTHCTLVLLDQLAVLHIPPASTAVWVKSKLPKLSPLTVTELPPLAALFSITVLITGPSKENRLSPVPATAPTVTGT
jgi:hypothetical protein